jgi:hypothetical protein
VTTSLDSPVAAQLPTAAAAIPPQNAAGQVVASRVTSIAVLRA